jgi:hypothetical protein
MALGGHGGTSGGNGGRLADFRTQVGINNLLTVSG